MATKKGAASKKGKKPPPSPQDFFARAAPRVLTALRTTTAELGGRYVIEVQGEGGGAWTLDFPAAAVRPGKEDGADLVVTLTAEQFAAVSTAKIELAKLVFDGSAPSVGERGRVENLSFVLAFLERG